MLRGALIVAVLSTSSLALADEATARKDFAAGERAYNLGEFDKAIDLFKKAYEEWPEPAFLFNVAQTYRQTGDCKQALFFYKRFLALKQNDTKKPIRPELKSEVEKRIVELEECMRRELASKPPDELDSGGGPTTTTNPATATPASTTTANAEPVDDGEDEEDEDDTPEPVTEQPKLVVVRMLGGAAKLNAGSLDVPIRFSGTLAGGYPLPLGPKLRLELGAALSFTPVPYETAGGESGSAALLGVVANVGVGYTIIPKLVGRVEAGAGASVFSGLDMMGNPFTENGNPASGGLTTFLARAAVSADYAVTPNIVITAMPIAFTYTPAPAGFLSTIPSLTTLTFMVGVGYQQ